MRRDGRHALRAVRRNALLSGVAVLSLGLGIGATTTVFSAIDAFHFRPLPFRNADRLVWIAELTPHEFAGCSRCPFLTSPATMRDWVEQVRSLEAVAAIRTTQFRWQHGDAIESLRAREATIEFFEVLGLRPLIGRGFTPADAVPGAEPVALLSDEFWRTRLGADAHILGRRLSTDSRDVTVVGILPAGFRFKENIQVWTPVVIDAQTSRSSRSLTVIARLRDGSSLESASAELDALRSRLALAYPANYRGWEVRVQSLRELFTMGRGHSRFRVLGLTLLVLLIAVLNVSGLMLSRALTRRQEFATRSALGATRAQLVRQLLVEGTCIGLAGAAVGVVLAFVMLPLVSAWFSLDTTSLDVDLNHRILMFAVAVAIVAGICTGIGPAIHAARAELGSALRERSSRTAQSAGARDVLAALQIAIALVLLATAALLSRDFLEVRYLNLGYNPKGLYFTSLGAAPQESRNPAAWREVASAARDRVAAIPGVASATLEHRSASRPKIVRPVGDLSSSASSLTPAVKAVDPAYFTTFGSRVLAGRPLAAGDDSGSPPVAIVNAAAARLFWPGRDPIGRQLFLGDSATAGELVTVVGMVEDAERGELIERHWPMVYRPFAQAPIYHAAGRLYVRVDDAQLETTVAAAQAAIRSTGRAVPPLESEESRVNEHFFQRQLNAVAFNLFAGVGLFLATIGIYASVAYGATLRTHEIGIRMALGATRWRIVTLLAGRQAVLALGGVIAGIIGVLALMRVLQSLLLGSSAINPGLLGGTGLLSIAVALAATCLPALRATRADAARALRAE